jgi:hypothetical protein
LISAMAGGISADAAGAALLFDSCAMLSAVLIKSRWWCSFQTLHVNWISHLEFSSDIRLVKHVGPRVSALGHIVLAIRRRQLARLILVAATSVNECHCEETRGALPEPTVYISMNCGEPGRTTVMLLPILDFLAGCYKR